MRMELNKSDSDPFNQPLPSGDEVKKSRSRRSSPRVRRDTKVRKKARNKILTEWRGGLNPPDPRRNIHEPSEYLDDLLKAVGLSDGIDEQQLKECWSRVAGDFVSKHSKPDSFKNGVLVLRIVQPMMKFHLEQMSSKLLGNLREELGKGVVKQVVFKIG